MQIPIDKNKFKLTIHPLQKKKKIVNTEDKTPHQ